MAALRVGTDARASDAHPISRSSVSRSSSATPVRPAYRNGSRNGCTGRRGESNAIRQRKLGELQRHDHRQGGHATPERSRGEQAACLAI